MKTLMRREWPVFVTLIRREGLKLVSERTRIAGLVLQPLLLWLIFSFGFDSGFGSTLGGAGEAAGASAALVNFREYFFPGAVLMTILFGCVFSSMTIIEDRAGGFLQSALVSPAHTLTVLAGKAFGVMLVTLLQVLVLVLLGRFLLPNHVEMNVMALAIWSVASCFCLIPINLGVALALNSTQSFHAFMGIALFPLWALSGAIFPMSGPGLRLVAMVNPLTYMVEGLRAGFCCASPGIAHSAGFVPGLLGILVLGAFGFVFAHAVMRRTSQTL